MRFSISWPLIIISEKFSVSVKAHRFSRLKKNMKIPETPWMVAHRSGSGAGLVRTVHQTSETSMAHGWAQTGDLRQAFIWIHHLKKPEGLSNEKSTISSQKTGLHPDDSHQLMQKTEWKCRVIHLQPGAGWPIKNDFPQANMISKSRKKHWNTMNQSQNGMKIFQKKHHINHKHLGSSWYILGLSWFLILSPVWIVLWCFFVEKCWKHETVANKVSIMSIALTAPIWAVPFWPGRFIELALFFWNIGSTVWDIFIHPLLFCTVVMQGALETEWSEWLMTLSWILQFPHLDILLLSNFSLRNAFFCLRKKLALFFLFHVLFLDATRCQWPWNPAAGWLHPWHNDRTMHDHAHTPCPKHPTSKAMCVEKSLGSSSGKAMPQPEVAALLKLFWEYGQVVSPKTRCDCMLKHKQFSGVKTSVFLNNVHWFFSLTTLHSSRAHECATLKDRALLCGKTFMLENIESWNQPVQSKSIKHMFKKMLHCSQSCKTYLYIYQ